jgi:hypothetical protein
VALNKARYTAILRHPNGERIKAQPIAVYQAGTTNKVTLYQSATSSTTADNPAWTDVNGQITFFCAPQLVDLVGVGYAEYGVPVFADADQVEALANLPQIVASFSLAGAQTASAKPARFPAPFDATLTGVRIALGTAPAGSSFIVDVNKAGTTIFTTQASRPTILAAANSGVSAAPDVTSVAAGDLLSFDVDQIGSGTAGSDLTVVVLGIPVL